MTFIDRKDAGEQLAEALQQLKTKDSVVLSLVRGGIILGIEIAKKLDLPLGVVLVRKIIHASASQHTLGVVAGDDPAVYDPSRLKTLGHHQFETEEEAARNLIDYRQEFYYGRDLEAPRIADKKVILVDDGIDSGLSMKAAIAWAQHRGAQHITVAAPIATQASAKELGTLADESVILNTPAKFKGNVGDYYADFAKISDDTVRSLLREYTMPEQLAYRRR